MDHILKNLINKLKLPTTCALCNQYHNGTEAVCAPCKTFITPIGPACRYCALPLPDAHFLVCGHCLRKKPDVDTVITAYRFDESIRALMHEFKYREGLYLSPFLTSLLLDAKPQNYQTQCLIPIPLHPKRLFHRGFNQAALLANHLSHKLKLPCERYHCKKIINTSPQAGLNAKQRKTNLKNAFLSKPLPYQHVTLIDDLVTTGSTANELARTLKNQGVLQVDLWCCARTGP